MVIETFLDPVFANLALNSTDHFTLLRCCYGEAGPCSNETPPNCSPKDPESWWWLVMRGTSSFYSPFLSTNMEIHDRHVQTTRRKSKSNVDTLRDWVNPVWEAVILTPSLAPSAETSFDVLTPSFVETSRQAAINPFSRTKREGNLSMWAGSVF